MKLDPRPLQITALKSHPVFTVTLRMLEVPDERRTYDEENHVDQETGNNRGRSPTVRNNTQRAFPASTNPRESSQRGSLPTESTARTLFSLSNAR